MFARGPDELVLPWTWYAGIDDHDVGVAEIRGTVTTKSAFDAEFKQSVSRIRDLVPGCQISGQDASAEPVQVTSHRLAPAEASNAHDDRTLAGDLPEEGGPSSRV